MGSTPSLEEFEARKRLVCSKMALHRAEISLCVHDIVEPYRKVQTAIRSVSSHPVGRVVLTGLAGFLLFSGKVVGKTSGLILTFFMPKIRSYFISQSGNILSVIQQAWQDRRK
jgi:hypothetical protein